MTTPTTDVDSDLAQLLEQGRPPVDSRLQFNGKRTSWRVRANTSDGRYTVATAYYFGKLAYTIIEWGAQIRGPLNVIGGGVGIFSSAGADPAIDRLLEQLDEGTSIRAEAEAAGAHCSGEWSISYRHRVPLEVTSYRRAS